MPSRIKKLIFPHLVRNMGPLIGNRHHRLQSHNNEDRNLKKVDFVKISIVCRGDFCECNGIAQLHPLPEGEGPKVAKIVNRAADFQIMEKDIEILLPPKDS